ncbi:lysozyme inhibitor LprI family protein [Dyella sp. S184]|uniref:lysozyme inhibitor LprI family protein n=1 Tax=Dyella sp. S184 TaxID=1641862 RepID=UPI00131B591C|nr:lysozyme inhibitor LprI family protein [Dyella sp. S184]
MKVWMFALAIGLFATFCVRADDKPRYPIDVWYDKAMDQTNGSTYAMIDVEGKAYEKWDAELNVVYQHLLHKLNAQDQVKLQEAERSWIAWRDSESAFSNQFWPNASGGQMGTLDRWAAIHEKVGTIRGRVIQLMGYEEDLAHPP